MALKGDDYRSSNTRQSFLACYARIRDREPTEQERRSEFAGLVSLSPFANALARATARTYPAKLGVGDYLLGEACIKILRSQFPVRWDSGIIGFLSLVLRRSAVDIYRRESRHHHERVELEQSEFVGACSEEKTGGRSQIIGHFSLSDGRVVEVAFRKVQDALVDLTEFYPQEAYCLKLRFFLDYTIPMVAKRMNLSEKEAKNLSGRATRRFKKSLAQAIRRSS